jgi:hypothetical protein
MTNPAPDSSSGHGNSRVIWPLHCKLKLKVCFAGETVTKFRQSFAIEVIAKGV